jgi:hypothetical protein
MNRDPLRSIPIYDATAPISCTASSDEIPRRLELVERMRTTLTRIERTEHGMLLHFPNRPEIEADLRRFAVDEKRCCQFWGFEVRSEPAGLTLRWDAPPALDAVIDDLVSALEGDEPITAFSGLL